MGYFNFLKYIIRDPDRGKPRLMQLLHDIDNIIKHSGIFIAMFPYSSQLENGLCTSSHHIWMQESRKGMSKGQELKGHVSLPLKKLSPQVKRPWSETWKVLGLVQ